MHEMAVTEDILRIVKDYAERGGAARVTDIYLVIGELSSFVDDSIQFYFDLLTPNTIAAGATLHFERVKTRFRCRKCGQEFEPMGRTAACHAMRWAETSSLARNSTSKALRSRREFGITS